MPSEKSKSKKKKSDKYKASNTLERNKARNKAKNDKAHKDHIAKVIRRVESRPTSTIPEKTMKQYKKIKKAISS